MLANFTTLPAYSVLIPNFEKAYPKITINITYTPLIASLYQLETTELAAGNAPDLLATTPGCGTPIAVCTLAKAGSIAPLLNEPWVKWSLPLVTSLDKYGPGLFAFTPIVAPYGMFTNDSLFKQLGLKIPQTFTQLLVVCQKAKSAGTVALFLPGAGTTSVQNLIVDLAVATLYGQDKQWAAKLKAGSVTFDGTPGWHEALQEFVQMNNAGCFEPGATGTTLQSVEAQFTQGQGLMLPSLSSNQGAIDAGNPKFTYSFYPFPGGTDANQTRTYLSLNTAVSVNAHSTAKSKAAAQTFVDFIARPKQNALFAQTTGGLTQYEFLKGQIPVFMSDYATVFKAREYVTNPSLSWWNANVTLALLQNEIGLITGQRSVDDVLNAMDAAWKQGPS